MLTDLMEEQKQNRRPHNQEF